MNRLRELNSAIEGQMRTTKKEVDRRRVSKGYVSASEYLLQSYRDLIAGALSPLYKEEELHLSFTDRKKLSCDMALRLPSLLKKHGATEYIQVVVPQLVEILSSLEGTLGIRSVDAKGIYVNFILDEQVLLDSLEHVHTLAERFGETDTYRTKIAVCEYSAPNAAKHLHAGHIRSTTVGESLSRIYDAVGYTTHRTNHINDWGGFGAILEGYERWQDTLRRSENKNDELYEVYLKYRELERNGGEEFQEFKEAASIQFAKLEEGDPATVEKWEEMIGWSLKEFNEFYSLFGITFDYSPGESFYVYRGKELVEDNNDGPISKLSESDIDSVINEIPQDTPEEEKKRLAEEIRSKVGAWVIRLGGGKLFVVQRSDGASIYTTRDLATVDFRASFFEPSLASYVVGVEQTEYFRELFSAAEKLSLFDSTRSRFNHVAIGHYISKDSGKKLSSRESALGVMELLEAAIDHFKKKYDDREFITVGLSQEDIAENAKKLAIGSVIFNDLRKEHTLPVELSQKTEETLKEFEESGGAYIMYSLARARAILRKADDAVGVKEVSLEPIEIELIKHIHELPEMIEKAAANHNAAVVGNYVLELARLYNSYYASYPVLNDSKVEFPHRLSITAAVAMVIENCLTLLNITAPDVL